MTAPEGSPSPEQVARAEGVVHGWPEFSLLDDATKQRVKARLADFQRSADADLSVSGLPERAWQVHVGALEPGSPIAGLTIGGIARRLEDGSSAVEFVRAADLSGEAADDQKK
ncbi:MAG TPA: hypothetical protein VHD60_03060 [Candidatus Saccharimonadales bacterium]|nr:hypothetical protein [Candidatus Saccharimonadales bacterium]